MLSRNGPQKFYVKNVKASPLRNYIRKVMQFLKKVVSPVLDQFLS